MLEYLRRDGSPALLQSSLGKNNVVALDNWLSGEELEEAILSSRETEDHYWKAAVEREYSCLVDPRRPGEDKAQRMEVKAGEGGEGQEEAKGLVVEMKGGGERKKEGQHSNFAEGDLEGVRQRSVAQARGGRARRRVAAKARPVKKIKLAVFPLSGSKRKSTTRAEAVDKKRLADLLSIVRASSRDGGQRREGEPRLVSAMPLAMGWAGGKLRGVHKSAGTSIVETYAPEGIMKTDERRKWKPDVVIVDYATITHQEPSTTILDGGSSRRLRTWREYCLHQLQSFLWQTCSRRGEVREIIFCLNERQLVPDTKDFAHAVRQGSSATTTEGGAKNAHKLGAGSRGGKREKKMCVRSRS